MIIGCSAKATNVAVVTHNDVTFDDTDHFETYSSREQVIEIAHNDSNTQVFENEIANQVPFLQAH